MALTRTTGRRPEEIELDLVLVALRERYGIDFSGYARTSLARRLAQVAELFAVAHVADLLPSLLRDAKVAQATINYISVPFSEFFRDPQVWKHVRQNVLPELESFPRINIWQIGCGHGQETWTEAILLQESGLAHKARMVTTDISADLLDAARRGRWPLKQFKDWRESYLASGGTQPFEDYSDFTDDEMAIRSSRLPPVEFVEHNLVSDDAFLETQLLICRNVLIYFGQALQARAFGVFERSLERGGVLVLGSAESIPAGATDLVPLQRELRIFRRSVSGDPCIES
jgi:chemotaxis protein methyltransferase CheR